jgi:hypothetical protein
MKTKTCSKCQVERPVTEFTRNATCRDGLDAWCKPCHAEYMRTYNPAYHAAHREELTAKMRARMKAKRAANPEGEREKNRVYNIAYRERNRDVLKVKRLARHGLTLDDHNALLASQNGGCAICGSTVPGGKGDFHIDHCHETGTVRGLLCHSCNTGLGLFLDEPARLRDAALYVEAHRLRLVEDAP